MNSYRLTIFLIISGMLFTMLSIFGSANCIFICQNQGFSEENCVDLCSDNYMFTNFSRACMFDCRKGGIDLLECEEKCIDTLEKAPEGIPEGISEFSMEKCLQKCSLEIGEAKAMCENSCKFGECVDGCIDNSHTREFCKDECISNIDTVISGEPAKKVKWTFEFWAMMGFFAIIVGALIGWYLHKVHRQKTVLLLEEVDNTYDKYKIQKELCIVELKKIRVKLKDDFKEGLVDESNFDFILDKIDRYINNLNNKEK